MKALWAFEPFHQDEARVSGMHQILCQLTGSADRVEVGFIVTRTEPSLNLAFDVPPEERFNVYPRKLIKEALKKSKIAVDDEKIHVLDYQTYSNTKAVDRLLTLAKSKKADLVALYTQSRKGLQRFAMGSFAETAIHRSPVDLLLVNPKVDFSKQVKQVFFLSDFTPGSKKHLKQVVQLCSRLKANLTVFHAAEVVYKWSFDEESPEVKSYRRKIEKTKSWVEQKCQSASVKCKVIIDSELESTSVMALEAATKAKADLLVVAAKSGGMKALMGGSTTRRLVRASTKPVLVLK